MDDQLRRLTASGTKETDGVSGFRREGRAGGDRRDKLDPPEGDADLVHSCQLLGIQGQVNN